MAFEVVSKEDFINEFGKYPKVRGEIVQLTNDLSTGSVFCSHSFREMYDTLKSTPEKKVFKDFSEIHFVLDYSKIEDQISLSKEGTAALQVVAYLNNKRRS